MYIRTYTYTYMHINYTTYLYNEPIVELKALNHDTTLHKNESEYAVRV